MAFKNVQGTGKARPKPMHKTHEGVGNHKKVFKTAIAAKSDAAGAPKVMSTGQC